MSLMNHRTFVVASIAVWLSALLVGCGGPGAGVDAAVHDVSLEHSSIEMTVGDTVELAVTVTAYGGASTAVAWSSSDELIVSVDAMGLVSARAVGSATITATSEEDATKAASVDVTVVPAVSPGDRGVLEVRFDGLPSDAVSVLSLERLDVDAPVQRFDLLGPAGIVAVQVPAGEYAARASEVVAAGDVRGLFARRDGSTFMVTVPANATVVRDVAFERTGDVADNVKVLPREETGSIVSISGSQVRFSERPASLADVAVGDVVVLQFDSSVDVEALFRDVARVSPSFLGWDDVIETWEDLSAFVHDAAHVVVEVSEQIGEFVLETVPANLANLVTRVDFHETVFIRRMPMMLPSVGSGPMQFFSGGAVLTDVELSVTFRARRVSVPMLEFDGLLEAHRPLAMPAAECYLIAGGVGWGLMAVADLAGLTCPVWLVVEAYDVHLRVGEFDLDVSLEAPTEGVSLSFPGLIAHAKALALVLSLDIDAGAGMPVVTLSANQPLEFRSSYRNDGTGTGGVYEEPISTPIEMTAGFGDRFGDLAVALTGVASATVAITDPVMILQAFAGAGAGVEVRTSSGDPTGERDVWPFELDVIAQVKAGVRYVWRNTAHTIVAMTPWRFVELPLIGDAKLAFEEIPAGLSVYYREHPDGTVRRVTRPFALVAANAVHEVWVEPSDAGRLTPVSTACRLVSVTDGGARLRLGGLSIRDVCSVEVSASPGEPDDVVVVVSPTSVTLAPSASQAFTATVTGSSDTSVSWSSTCGTIVGSGSSVTYIAPGASTNCTVTATSTAEPTRSASASVQVQETGAPSWRVAPTQLAFDGEVGGPAPTSQSFVLHNDGSAASSFSLSTSSMVTVSPSSGTVASGGSATITVSVGSCPDAGTTTSQVTVSGGGRSATLAVSRTCGEPLPDVGMIQLVITGLPGGVDADVFIQGQGWMLWPTSSVLLPDMPAGGYQLTAGSVTAAGVTYEPTPPSASFTVHAGETTTVTIDYAEVVVGAPVWRTVPTQLDFASELGESPPAPQAFVLHNDGTAAGSFSLSTSSMVQVSPSSGTVAAGGSTSITVSVAACEDEGTVTSQISVSGGESSATVGVSLTCGPALPDVGMIQVVITGLPGGVDADVFIQGQGWMLWPTSSVLLPDMPAGGYQLTAGSVTAAGVTYEPTPPSASFTVHAGETTTVSVAYEAVHSTPLITDLWMNDYGDRFDCGSIISHERIEFRWSAVDPSGGGLTYEYRVDGASWVTRNGTSVVRWFDDRPLGQWFTFEVRAISATGVRSPIASCTGRVSRPPEIMDFAGPTDALGFRVGEQVTFAVDVRDPDGHYPSEALVFVYPPGGGVTMHPMTLLLDQGPTTKLTYVTSVLVTSAGVHQYVIWVTDALGVMADATDQVAFTIYP